MIFPEALHSLTSQIVALSGAVVALGAIATAGNKSWSYFSRSRFLVPNAFPLPEVQGEEVIFAAEVTELRTLLVGRQTETGDLQKAVMNSGLTFVYGESGSGKSTLMKLGVARKLVQSGSWIPLYVDVWGQDWVKGPTRSLASTLNAALRALTLATDEAVTTETVFVRLGDLLRVTGRTPVLIFDQIDDYQNANRRLFTGEEANTFLKPAELCAANPFWEAMSKLLTVKACVHLVLVTRTDAKEGLHCFEFEVPTVCTVSRIDASNAKELIRLLSPETVVNKPENGFQALVDRTVAALGRNHGGTILPMQLRVAFAGIGRLGGPLTPSRLERLGGLPGLGAKYLESALVDVPGAWPILNRMAERTPDGGGKAALLSRHQILGIIPNDQDPEQMLQKLVDSRVLRRRLEGSEEETWQLYHDYIADAVIAVDSRKQKWNFFLGDAAERWHDAEGPVQWWSRLLCPRKELTLLLISLREPGFRFGEHSNFIRMSMLRLVVNLYVISAALAYTGFMFVSDHREASVIADSFYQRRDRKHSLVALWHLAATRSDWTRITVFNDLVTNPLGIIQLDQYSDAVTAALGLKISSFSRLKDVPQTGECSSRPNTDSCFDLLLDSGSVKSDALVARIVEQMSRSDCDSATLAKLGISLAKALRQQKLASKEKSSDVLAEGKADAGVQVFISRWEKDATHMPDNPRDFALKQLFPQTSDGMADTFARELLEIHQRQSAALAIDMGDRDPAGLESALASVAPRLSEPEAFAVASGYFSIVGNFGATRSSHDDLFAAVSSRISVEHAKQLSELMLSKLKGLDKSAPYSVESFELQGFKAPLAFICEKAGSNQAQECMQWLAGHSSETPYQISFTATALAAMPTELTETEAHKISNLMSEMLSVNRVDFQLTVLPRSIAKLHKFTDAQAVNSALDVIVEQNQGDADSVVSLSGLADLLPETDKARAGTIAEALLSDKADRRPLPEELRDLLIGYLQDSHRRRAKLVELSSASNYVNCALANSGSSVDDLPLMIDMLKWPVCGGSRDGLMLHVAQLLGKQPTDFGSFDTPQRADTFHADLRQFILWLQKQKDSKGKSFDLDGPPRFALITAAEWNVEPKELNH